MQYMTVVCTWGLGVAITPLLAQLVSQLVGLARLSERVALWLNPPRPHQAL